MEAKCPYGEPDDSCRRVVSLVSSSNFEMAADSNNTRFILLDLLHRRRFGLFYVICSALNRRHPIQVAGAAVPGPASRKGSFMRRHVLIPVSGRNTASLAKWRAHLNRSYHIDSRQRVSSFWIPPIQVKKKNAAPDALPDATELLTRAGYLRQAYAGIFHMLPLGLRVQNKIEGLIDKHMRSIKASKVSLSSISSQALWRKSGRLKAGGEMFTFKDRKDAEWLLAPTHEEEITALVANYYPVGGQLPVRLYQIGRKYRDEKRPRGGLLRGREFLMKDLYTFDAEVPAAHATYDEIRSAYRRLLDELTIKYVEARADSGDMGGNLSHEYHLPNPAGEDIVITCSECDYARNEEFVSQQSYPPQLIKNRPQVKSSEAIKSTSLLRQDLVSKDGHTLVRAIAPGDLNANAKSGTNSPSLNSYTIKAALKDVTELDSGIEDPLRVFEASLSSALRENCRSKLSIYYVLDRGVEPDEIADLISVDMKKYSDRKIDFYIISGPKNTHDGISLLKHEIGDACPECQSGKLRLEKAIEIGHTFHLGARYSAKLGLAINVPGKGPVPVEMGCHGIGVSRLVAAIASCLADETGLNWPRVIAPFEAVIVWPYRRGSDVAEQVYDALCNSPYGPVDAILDDRPDDVSVPWKLNDADIIGYPVIIVVGKRVDEGKVEVQCRRLKVKQDVDISAVPEFVHRLLAQL